MTDLPTKAHLSQGDTTEAQFQAAIAALYDYVSELVTGAAPEVNQIDSSGVITPESTFITVDTENGELTSDNLDRISPSNIGAKIIVMRLNSAARPVTLRHQQTGTGQLYLNTAANVTLDNTRKIIAFYYNSASSQWEELWKNWGVLTPEAADKAAVISQLALGTAALVNTGTASGEVPTNAALGALAYLSTINSSSLLGAGVVTNDKVADGTLALTKLANQTAYRLPWFNASGLPALITVPNNTTTFLRGDGTFAAPTAQGAQIVADVDLNALQVHDITWTAGLYKGYTIEFVGEYTGADGARLHQFNNGVLTSNSDTDARNINNEFNGSFTGSSGMDYFGGNSIGWILSQGNTAGWQSCVLHIPSVTSDHARGVICTGKNNQSLFVFAYYRGGISSNFNGIRIRPTGIMASPGTFKNGSRIRVIGYP